MSKRDLMQNAENIFEEDLMSGLKDNL